MQKNQFMLLSTLLLLMFSCGREGLKKYYTRISPEELESYDTVTLVSRSKYGKIFQVHNRASKHFTSDFLVFEKISDGKKDGLFKMDESVELKNDTTLILYGITLKISGDTSNWINGLWFYSRNKGNAKYYSEDSMPHNVPKVDYHKLSMGIYQYKTGKLVKVASQQSEDALDSLNSQGFFYLPNPGRFYILANLSQIN